jgi:hypothetical protein
VGIGGSFLDLLLGGGGVFFSFLFSPTQRVRARAWRQEGVLHTKGEGGKERV